MVGGKPAATATERYNGGMRTNRKSFRTSRLASRCLTGVIGIAIALVTYMVSIGPVYYFWARCSADMATHATIEQFYSPLLSGPPGWLRRQLIDYRDVARIAGYRGPTGKTR